MNEAAQPDAAPAARAGARTGGGKASRSRRQRLSFAGLLVLFAWLLAEGLGVIAWWWQSGSCFSYGRAAAARSAVLAEVAATGPTGGSPAGSAGGSAAAPAAAPAVAPLPTAADPQRAVNAGSVVHPYVGYVNDGALGNVAGYPISTFGYLDGRSPVRPRDPATFVVGLVGGSVALQLGLYAEAEFAAALQRSAQVAGRRVEFVRLCLGGYKQPQQLMAVSMVLALGGHFDLVVNVDGFNEVALVGENVPLGVPAWYPRGWARLLDSAPTTAQLRRLGELVVLREQRRARVDVAEALWWSPLSQFVWRALDRRVQARIGELVVAAERAPVADNFAVHGPGPGSSSLADAQAEMAAVWRRSSIALHGLCAAHGIPYVHCLQPNQHVPGSKPIGAAEAAVAVAAPDDAMRTAVVSGYPLLRREAEALRAAGVAFHDLTTIFRDHAEPLYVDPCCHLDRTGNVLLGEHVAAAVRARLDGDVGPIIRLDVTPPRLLWSSPLQELSLQVRGIAADGRWIDATGVGAGSRMVAEPAGAVAVAPGGSVRAQRRGDGELTVQWRQFTAKVPFTAAWADLVDGADGRRGGGGEVLQLTVGAEAGRLRIRHQGHGEGLRVLAIATEPLPTGDRAPERLAGLVVEPLANVDGEHTVAVPGAGMLFVRAYLVSTTTGKVAAASNCWVWTKD